MYDKARTTIEKLLARHTLSHANFEPATLQFHPTSITAAPAASCRVVGDPKVTPFRKCLFLYKKELWQNILLVCLFSELPVFLQLLRCVRKSAHCTYIQLDWTLSINTWKTDSQKTRKGYIRQFRDHHWKALGKENPNILDSVLNNHFLPLIL